MIVNLEKCKRASARQIWSSSQNRFDVGNMLIFGPVFAHIFSVQHIVKSAEFWWNFANELRHATRSLERKMLAKGVSSQLLESPFLPWEAVRKCATALLCCRLLMKYFSGGENHVSKGRRGIAKKEKESQEEDVDLRNVWLGQIKVHLLWMCNVINTTITIAMQGLFNPSAFSLSLARPW